MASSLVRRVRAIAGDDALQKVLRRAGVSYSAGYLEDLGNWIWYEEAVALFEAAAEVTGERDIARRVGEDAVRQHAGTPVATLLRSLGSPQAIFQQLTDGVSKFSTVTELIPRELGPGRFEVSARAREGFVRHPRLCEWTTGLLATPPELFGMPPAHVEETSCQGRGDEQCRYEIHWDAEEAAGAGDPQKLVTALESQLAAMSDRLESMYATARDLIAIDDLDAALARITERAATAVRAPEYLLAVRAGAGGKLRVHHWGLSEQNPEAAALALLEGEADAQPGQLVVEIASGTRRYGRLMAATPGGSFFPHERDLFDVYARYAAAVLDTASAFDEARRRDQQSRALLELSRALAVATTSDEVAERLAGAVPVVVDCDRVVAFLWDEEDESLVCRAITGDGAEADSVIRTMRIRRSDTPALAQLLDDPAPRPLYFEASTDDEFVANVLRQTGGQAMLVVPIVAHDRFYGILNVTVTERPERLDPTTELLAVLAGVVAQAATALDNARLIETMAHQARFDNLTGLLGHRAFHEALEIELERTGRNFTLASIDIDDFKLVNDLHGHPVGDEALRRVAEALRCSVREQDSVFRVGGEEFAIVMPGLTSDDARGVAERVRQAVAETPFIRPLRVSVGLASFPEDADARDALLARVDGALYAAKRSGKDRIVGAAEGDTIAVDTDVAGDLLDVLRAKDSDTLVHSSNVARLAVSVGKRLALSAERLEQLRIAGHLHDVGKLAVPDAVLNKPGPLDADEMRIVRTHPVVGAELVRAWGFDQAAKFVLEHHERIDGGGYPSGLAGEDITLEARILHVADAFCAMTSDRPYRRAMSVADALAELRSLSGTQFDPRVVAAVEAACAGDELPDWTVETVERRGVAEA